MWSVWQDRLQNLALVLASLAGAIASIALIGKYVKMVYRTLKRANILFDQLLGDKGREQPSLLDRLKVLESAVATVDAKLTTHAADHRHTNSTPTTGRRPR